MTANIQAVKETYKKTRKDVQTGEIYGGTHGVTELRTLLTRVINDTY